MGKKLAIYCDGTWNQASPKQRTNVARLFEATLPAGKATPLNPQLIIYVKGVGTRWEEKIRGGAFGYGISDNIKSAYSFIVANYESGDEIFLFGFSRGAYTARSIAGLIRNIGVLRRDRLHLADYGFNKYRDRASEWVPDGAAAGAFRKENSHPGESIEFIGVWDTVGSLGAPYGVIIGWIVAKVFKCSFHDTKLSGWVKSAYHALAADERRWPFRPTLWELNASHLESNAAAKRAGKIPNYEQCWFPGVHSNVGGGYDSAGLSDIALQWMADRAGHHGLNVDLGLVACKADITATIENSQKPVLRLMTKLFVLYPSKLWLVGRFILPKETRDLACHITPEGDYVRPIDLANDNVEVPKEKKAKDSSYLPKNIP